jgi:hypothetical protein
MLSPCGVAVPHLLHVKNQVERVSLEHCRGGLSPANPGNTGANAFNKLLDHRAVDLCHSSPRPSPLLALSRLTIGE